ncbi:hypothetical protein BD309DRAFT_553648 [Dichomitus squalens]|nr:hypothetical protein BD309DRAFT_553648 [Dichomitus squalens]
MPIALISSSLASALSILALAPTFVLPSKDFGELRALLAGAIVMVAALGAIACILVIIRHRCMCGDSWVFSMQYVLHAAGYMATRWLEMESSGPKDALMLGATGVGAPLGFVPVGCLLHYCITGM